MVIKRGEADEYLNYFKIPYALVRDPKFKKLRKNKNAVMLYGMMRDQVTLSLKNNLVDEKGVYQFFKVDRIQEELGGISRETANKAKKKLIEFGLIEVKKSFNGADRIYVNKVTEAVVESSKNELPKVQKMNCESSKNELPKVQNLDSNQPNLNQPNLTRLIEPDDDRASTLYSNSTIGRALRENGIRVNHRHHQELLEYVGRENMSFDMIVRAIEITADSEKPSFKYLRGILENWRKQGFTSLEQVEEHERQRKQPKQEEYDGIGNIPEWSSMHPDNAGKPKEESGYNSKKWQKWLEEKKKNGR